jgi:transcriptional regulator
VSAVVAGKSEKEIAGELGTTRNSVNTIKKHPETQNFIRQLSAALTVEIERNNRRMVDVIYEGMNAKTVANRPDHKIRQSAVANQIKLLGTIQPKNEGTKPDIAVTISELREALSR